jgi:hypothetical protein
MIEISFSSSTDLVKGVPKQVQAQSELQDLDAEGKIEPANTHTILLETHHIPLSRNELFSETSALIAFGAVRH